MSIQPEPIIIREEFTGFTGLNYRGGVVVIDDGGVEHPLVLRVNESTGKLDMRFKVNRNYMKGIYK